MEAFVFILLLTCRFLLLLLSFFLFHQGDSLISKDKFLIELSDLSLKVFYLIKSSNTFALLTDLRMVQRQVLQLANSNCTLSAR